MPLISGRLCFPNCEQLDYAFQMHSQNPFLDEFAKLTTTAMGLAQAAGEEAKTAFRAQADRFVAEMDLVRRDELDLLRAEITDLRAQIEALKADNNSK